MVHENYDCYLGILKQMFANKRVPNLMSKVRILEEKKKDVYWENHVNEFFFFLKTAIKNEMGTKQKLKNIENSGFCQGISND